MQSRVGSEKETGVREVFGGGGKKPQGEIEGGIGGMYP